MYLYLSVFILLLQIRFTQVVITITIVITICTGDSRVVERVIPGSAHTTETVTMAQTMARCSAMTVITRVNTAVVDTITYALLRHTVCSRRLTRDTRINCTTLQCLVRPVRVSNAPH